MKAINFIFNIHQPFRLKRYRFFEIGNDHYYYDDFANEDIFSRIAHRSYIPAAETLLRMIENTKGKFRCAISISGDALEQTEQYAPEFMDLLKKLADTGKVEFLGMPYPGSLASLIDPEEFMLQVKVHAEKIKTLFGQTVKVIRNTELIYSDEIAPLFVELGFKGCVTEGAKHIHSDPQFRAAPPIFAYISNGEKAAAVANLRTAEAKPERSMFYDITPFGMLDDIYSYRYISASGLEGLSRNIHLVYEDIFSQTDIDVADALQRYNLFEVNKGSNRANALHIRYKLAMLGLDYTDEKDAVEVNFDDFLTEEVLDRLTVAEHDRWMAFLESEGWSAATVEESKAYQVSGVSKGRHNCPLLNLHPYICPFDELPERSDKLGLPDSTVYDRELIARIPDILHDKWGVSGKRYKIIQRARREESIHERTE